LPAVFPDVRNPGGFSTDGTVFKNFYLSEDHGRYVNIRFEAYNILNHSNYGSLDANPNTIGFGGVNGKAGPVGALSRTVQIGARIFF
jgi:hypothetical protein